MPLSSSWKKLIFGNDVLALQYTILRATIHFDYAIFNMIIVWFRRFKELRRIILMLKILLTEDWAEDGRRSWSSLSIVEVYNTRCTWPLADSYRHEIGRRCNRSDGFNFFVFRFCQFPERIFFISQFELSARMKCPSIQSNRLTDWVYSIKRMDFSEYVWEYAVCSSCKQSA